MGKQLRSERVTLAETLSGSGVAINQMTRQVALVTYNLEVSRKHFTSNGLFSGMDVRGNLDPSPKWGSGTRIILRLKNADGRSVRLFLTDPIEGTVAGSEEPSRLADSEI